MTKYITNDIAVYELYGDEYGDHGEGDAFQTLVLAPQVGGDYCEWLYITTNGDPVIVGFRDDPDGMIQLADEAREWISLAEYAWVRGLIISIDDQPTENKVGH
jgi:hypothetical protein